MKEIFDGTSSTLSHWRSFVKGKPVVLVDFDHTITKECLACRGYSADLSNRQVQRGAREAMQKLAKKYKIIIFTGNVIHRVNTVDYADGVNCVNTVDGVNLL